jgi:hypothetical protein
MNQIMKILEELEQFFSSNNNYKQYRDSIAEKGQPTIPHMAIFLQDLTFIEDGNSATIKGLINVEQKRQMTAVISLVMECQGKSLLNLLFRIAV